MVRRLGAQKGESGEGDGVFLFLPTDPVGEFADDWAAS